MNMSILTQTITQACQVTRTVYTKDGRHGEAARAGRNIFITPHIEGKKEWAEKFGCAVLLKKAGIQQCDVRELVENMASELATGFAVTQIVDAAFTNFLVESWGNFWGDFQDRRISGFSVRNDEGRWQSANDANGIKALIASVPSQEWLARGFWPALRWLITNHEGANAINGSEFFKVRSLSDMFRIRGQLTWWASFAERAYELVGKANDRELEARNLYEESGCNTHYLGEAEQDALEATKRHEKALEAKELLAEPAVTKFLEDLVNVFVIAGRDEPKEGEYHPAALVEKQLADMEVAAENAVANLEKMLAAALAQGVIGE